MLEPCRGLESCREVAVGALPGPCGAHREVQQGADSCSSSQWLPGWPHAELLTCNAQHITATCVPDAAELRQAGDLAMTTSHARWSWGPLVLCWGPDTPGDSNCIPSVVHQARREHHSFPVETGCHWVIAWLLSVCLFLQRLGLNPGLCPTPAQAPAAWALLLASVWSTAHCRH